MGSEKFSLADTIRESVGEASAAVPATIAGERTIESITSEILQLKTDAGNAIIQIGERLIEAKEKLPHGEWLPWLNEKVDFSERTARNFMRLAREWTNRQALADLGSAKALTLLALPEPERDEFMQAHDVPNMSTRELEDAIRERDEARRMTASAEAELAKMAEAHDADLIEIEGLAKRVKELESRPVDVAVQVDEAAVQRAADEARRATVEEWQKKTAKLDEALKKAEEKLKEAREKAKQGKTDAEAGRAASEELDAARKAQEAAEVEAEQLRAELEQAQKAAKAAAVAGDAEVAAFKLYFEAAQENINKLRGLLLKVRGREDKTTGEKLTAALTALADAVKEAAQ